MLGDDDDVLVVGDDDDVAAGGADTMVDWDEEKLEQVVMQKHAESDMKKPKTEIVICCHLTSS